MSYDLLRLPLLGYVTILPRTIGTSSHVLSICGKSSPISQLSGHPGDTCKKPSTPWCSRAVPQPSTDPALHRLATEFGWDPACSMQYGRRLLLPVTLYGPCAQLSGHPKKYLGGKTFCKIGFFLSAICSTYYFALS